MKLDLLTRSTTSSRSKPANAVSRCSKRSRSRNVRRRIHILLCRNDTSVCADRTIQLLYTSVNVGVEDCLSPRGLNKISFDLCLYIWYKVLSQGESSCSAIWHDS